jgi:hypothetical protein
MEQKEVKQCRSSNLSRGTYGQAKQKRSIKLEKMNINVKLPKIEHSRK